FDEGLAHDAAGRGIDGVRFWAIEHHLEDGPVAGDMKRACAQVSAPNGWRSAGDRMAAHPSGKAAGLPRRNRPRSAYCRREGTRHMLLRNHHGPGVHDQEEVTHDRGRTAYASS